MLVGPGVDVSHLEPALLVDEDVFWLDISQFRGPLPDVLLGNCQSIQHIPKLTFFENGIFGAPLLDEGGQLVGVKGVLILNQTAVTVSVPVSPQMPLSVLKLFLSKRASKSSDEVDERNIESITETNKASGFFTGINIQTAGKNCRLVGNDTNALTVVASKTNDNVLSVVLVYL